jgi:hypothetical protein
MAKVPRVITDLAECTSADLEALESEHPELGRLEVIDGALHATGGSAVGDRHQLVVQRLFLLLVSACPAAHIVRIDTWWRSSRGLLRPDIAVYRVQDRPADRRVFTVPPRAAVEVLSEDAHHDLVRKDGLYTDSGVAHRAYVDPWGRFTWWCRLDGTDHDGPTVTWELEEWPPLRFDRASLLAD